MKNKYLGVITLISAILISIIAAYFSVTGLSQLFVGATISVIIMASCLEFSKLVIATILHNYWNILNKLLKIYLSLALFILVLITSAGIYGYLSAAYQESSNKMDIVNNKITNLENKKKLYNEQLTNLNYEKNKIVLIITSLNNSLGNNILTHTDKNGNIITTSSSSNRKAYEKQLDINNIKVEKIDEKINTLNDTINNINNNIIQIKSNDDSARELGPLKYIAQLTNIEMNKIINVLMLIIIFVFDPLAICLVLTANYILTIKEKQNNNKEYKIYESDDISRDNINDNNTNSFNDTGHNENTQVYNNEVKKEVDTNDVWVNPNNNKRIEQLRKLNQVV